MSKPVNTLWEAKMGAYLSQPDWEPGSVRLGGIRFGSVAPKLGNGHRAERASNDCSAPKEPHPMCR